ncbi:LOW QUALITY PROTEIN: protein FORGETTER 1-like [Pecten maximus]|uniref:LOW QUALITY PROTEIN: protein FORGETTER 1-like n=1 Tax=Pecten maximus TaxID=6579 RepID=UPI001458991B|nr:LOW QUALITY PROTEIN: protein FORGETTER 1-like [Pecten maximus]
MYGTPPLNSENPMIYGSPPLTSGNPMAMSAQVGYGPPMSSPYTAPTPGTSSQAGSTQGSSYLMGQLQSPVHPILQQIDAMNNMYARVPTTTVQGQGSLQMAGQQPDQEEIKDDGVQESVSSEVFSVYKYREIVPGCQPHPGDIVEAGPLASLLPPEPVYPLADSLPREMITSCKLSSLQLEGILYACQRHQTMLPNGQRAGFFIGDAAGVGKGRQIAGIIVDNYARKRTKHIWFTISSDLIVDSRRDLTDIGCYVKVIDGCQELDRETRVLGLPADFKEGIVFSTYATLVSSVYRGSAISGSKTSRLQQLVDWCGGPQFQGCLIFDECHKAKNFVPGKEHASTKVAMAVMSIQRMLPKARVVYCSATGVTDVKNMAFMERLGLWGDGAPFRSFEQFLDLVQKKGLGMAEILAMEMKTSGMYISRGLSYKQAEFMTIEAALTKEQRKMYDTAAHVWNELRKALESALSRTDTQGGRMWAQFWASHQRFFKQLCMGMKVPSVIKKSTEALDAGFCVVIGLQTTGEASLEAEIGKNKGEITGFVSLCREILLRFITQYFPTMIEAQNSEDRVPDSWSVQAKEMLIDFARKISLPNSPLDEMIDQLGGTEAVAEMTGRRGRIVRKSAKDQPHYELRTQDIDNYGGIESLNVTERNMFMAGKKFVAIISDAASTGISLHADTRAGNQRRRVHLTVELPWSADKAVQQLGRSHRSNQSSGPLYKLLTTDLGGERRFAAAVARRLQSMGALTKGDRRAATGANLDEFNFDTPYGRNALRSMYHHICHRTLVPGLNLADVSKAHKTFEEFNVSMQECLVLMGLIEIESVRIGAPPKDKDMGDVSKFLNRILGLGVTKQNVIFTYFMECMKLMIQNAKTEGRYNEGMLDIKASSVEMVNKPKGLFKNLTKGHADTKLLELKVDRGVSWSAALTRLETHKGPKDGFYISKREIFGRKLYILATQKENSNHLFRYTRPNTGLSQVDEEETDLNHRYVAVDPSKAEKAWTELYEQALDQCVHGKSCKNGRRCKVGIRCYNIHLVCGSIVSLMSVLEATLNRFAAKLNLSKSESSVRVVRVQLDSGERVVGVRYPLILLSEVEKVLKEQHMVERIQLSQSVRNPDDSVAASGSDATSSSVEDDGKQEVKSVVEEVTPVNAKSLARALRPPVTLKTFFKSAGQKKTENACESRSGSPSSPSQSGLDKHLSDEDKDSIVSSCNDNTTSNKNHNSDNLTENDDKQLLSQSSANLEKCGSSTSNVQSSETRESNSSKTSSDSMSIIKSELSDTNCKISNSPISKPDSNSGKSSISKKRSAASGESSRAAKRPRQSNIMSMFAKATAKKEAKPNMSCPICGKEFEGEVKNTEINQHIDNCLIE